MSLSQNEDPATNQWCVTLACKVLIGYLLICIVIGALLSDPVLQLLGLNEQLRILIDPIKKWLFILVTAPLLYWIVAKLTQSFQRKNELLEKIKSQVVRLNRMHRIISESSHIILRSHDRRQLLREICNVIQDKGNYAFVWIGLGETDAIIPQMIVTSNEQNQYLHELFDGLQLSSVEEKEEPSLSCFQNKFHIVVNDVKKDPKKQLKWQKRALENRFSSIAAFPLRTSSGWVGVLSIYAHEVNVFSEEESKLLGELAADISYGLSDIEQKEKLYYAANYDVVTNLPNAELLADRLNQSIARAVHRKRVVGLACVELVELDEIINIYGQAAGNKILQETSKHFTRLVRDGDTIARLSDKALGVMLTDLADVYDIPMVIQKIIQPFMVQLTNYKELSVKMRAGVSVFPKDAENGVTMIKNAELALRGISNHENIDCAYFSKDIIAGMKYTRTIETELETALEKKEFSLYYQPVIDLSSQKVVAMEAMLRWHNAKLGDLTAMQFIHIAENKQLIASIDEWVIKSACEQLIKWKKEGHELALSVNLSPKTLLEPVFIPKLRSIFSSIDFRPEEYELGFEIPETLFSQTSQDTLTMLEALKNMKIKINIEDFGTGYASLGYIHRLPIDTLKISPILVRNSEREISIRTMIQGIIAFADGIGAKVIAEGIETQKQLQLMRELKCQYGQGFIISPPMIAKDVRKLLG